MPTIHVFEGIEADVDDDTATVIDGIVIDDTAVWDVINWSADTAKVDYKHKEINYELKCDFHMPSIGVLQIGDTHYKYELPTIKIPGYRIDNIPAEYNFGPLLPLINKLQKEVIYTWGIVSLIMERTDPDITQHSYLGDLYLYKPKVIKISTKTS